MPRFNIRVSLSVLGWLCKINKVYIFLHFEPFFAGTIITLPFDRVVSFKVFLRNSKKLWSLHFWLVYSTFTVTAKESESDRKTPRNSYSQTKSSVPPKILWLGLTVRRSREMMRLKDWGPWGLGWKTWRRWRWFEICIMRQKPLALALVHTARSWGSSKGNCVNATANDLFNNCV